MRKIGAFFASLVILFGFPMPTINAASVAVKNGATCTQLRSVVKLAADQYICLKSGNKKLWTKLIKAKTPDLPILFSETPWVNFDFGSAPPINQEKPVGPASGSIPNVVLDGLCAPLGAIQTTSMGEAYSCKASSVDGKGRWSK